MCPKIDMMERECKKLEFGGDLNKTLVYKIGRSEIRHIVWNQMKPGIQ
jgi:hypothetical protein